MKTRTAPKGKPLVSTVKPPVAFGGNKPLPREAYGAAAIRTIPFPTRVTCGRIIVSKTLSEVTDRRLDRAGAEDTAYKDPKTRLYYRKIAK